jgi:hypothetical protein
MLLIEGQFPTPNFQLPRRTDRRNRAEGVTENEIGAFPPGSLDRLPLGVGSWKLEVDD